MTQEEKSVIINYCMSQIGGIGNIGLLSYYLDHKDEIDPKALLIQQKANTKASLEKKLVDIQAQLKEINVKDNG